MEIFNFFRITGVEGKEKELKIIINNMIQEHEFKYTTAKEFEKLGIEPKDVLFVLQPEEYARPLELIKETPIFEISEKSDKIFLIRNQEILGRLNTWLASH